MPEQDKFRVMDILGVEETLYFVFTIVCGFLAVCNGVAAIAFFAKMLIEVVE